MLAFSAREICRFRLSDSSHADCSNGAKLGFYPVRFEVSKVATKTKRAAAARWRATATSSAPFRKALTSAELSSNLVVPPTAMLTDDCLLMPLAESSFFMCSTPTLTVARGDGAPFGGPLG